MDKVYKIIVQRMNGSEVVKEEVTFTKDPSMSAAINQAVTEFGKLCSGDSVSIVEND